MPRPSIVVAPLVAAVALSGCERGCLATWLRDHGVGGEGHRGSADRDARAPSFDLSGTDCSDGLARCVGGRVEASRVAHLTARCDEPAERAAAGCVCPWDVVGRCAAGCAAEGLVAIASPDVAAAQLCRSSEPVARGPLPSELGSPRICGSAGLVCEAGVIRACDGPRAAERVVAVCVNGCASDIAVDPDDARTGDGVIQILCRRAHAERQ